jgi:hypothetical protein
VMRHLSCLHSNLLAAISCCLLNGKWNEIKGSID